MLSRAGHWAARIGLLTRVRSQVDSQASHG